MKKTSLLAALLFGIPLTGNSVVLGGSNLGFSGYPSHSCTKPIKPFKPYALNEQWQVDSYNSQVDLYNLQFQQYIDCVKIYLGNIDNDIKRAREKAQEAIDETNQ